MQRIVLDTNCLLQSLPTKSPYHQIWTDVMRGRVCLCVNTEILNDYEEILAQKINPEVANNVVEAIARLHTTIYQEIYVHFGLIHEGPDDNKFVDCAVASSAKYIVTNDKHYNVLKGLPWPQLAVVNINEFMAEL